MRRVLVLAVFLCACDRKTDAPPPPVEAAPPVAVVEPTEPAPTRPELVDSAEPVEPDAAADVYALRLTDELFWLDDAALTRAVAEGAAGRVRVEPADAGWKIVEIRDGSLAQMLGLRVGDIVRTIQDRVVPDVDAWLDVVGELQRGKSFAVQLDRGGQPMTLRYELRTGRRDSLGERQAQLLAIVELGVYQAPGKLAIDRAILRQIASSGAIRKFRRPTRADLLRAMGLPSEGIVAIAATTLARMDDVLPALGRQASAEQFDVDIQAYDGTTNRIVVTVVEGRIVERDLEAALGKFPQSASGLVEPEPSSDEPPPVESVDAAAAYDIVAVDETHYEMPSKRRDELIADPSVLVASARIVPSESDGKPDGFKLYGIRRGSLAKAIGLKNGDRVTAIAGMRVASVQDVLDAYAKVRTAKKVVLDVERKGSQRSITITFE